MLKPKEGYGELNRLVKAAAYSLNGLRYALKNECSFRSEVILMTFALAAALIFARKAVDIIYLMTPLVLTLAFELCNTALEKTVDEFGNGQITQNFKAIKDCASAAVFLMIILSLVTWAGYFCLS